MQTVTLSTRLEKARQSFFTWRLNLDLTRKLALAFGAACLTGLAAQVRIPIPGTPVPVTSQTLAVLLAGVLLGRWWGGISQALYVAIGAAGLPWFSGMQGGLAYLAGPTGGYLAGFVLAALFIGYVVDQYPAARGWLPMLAIMCFANFALIHGCGLAGLGAWTWAVQGSVPSLHGLLLMGTLPFLTGDVLKILLATASAACITPDELSENGDGE